MKIPHLGRHSQRGVALVIVLTLLVLVLGLVVTFLNRAGIERTAASGFAAASSLELLADTAVSLVKGQIRDATTQGDNVAWASQPGMVRTFASGSAGSYSPGESLLRAYKLYSSDKMIVDSGNPMDGDLPPAGWSSDKALWTDLNAPVVSSGATNYPILNPAALGAVEGFAVDASAPTNAMNRIPMPVRWLYVLRNGNLVSPSGGGTNATVSGAASTNEIVGRIAFWADDETAKININTASEGTMWDAPRTTSQQDKDMARAQPVRNEFQRYPGHPAMTSIAPALFATSSNATPPLTDAQREAVYSITPRVVGGGSDAGKAVTTNSITPDTDRLYTSVDEMIFNVQRSPQAAAAGLTRDKVDRLRFFLTATSRAPETTLFNTPRVSIWPLDVQDTANHRSALDRLFAFVSTINPGGAGGGQRYYFQRSDPRSTTADYDGIERNKQLFAYLQALSARPFPGFGGSSLGTKYGTDRDQILTEILDYIRLTNPDDALLAPQYRFGYRAQLPPIDTSSTTQRGGHNQIVPLRIGPNQGFGRFPVISEVGVGFIATADGGDGSAGGVAGSNSVAANVGAGINKTLGGTLLKANERRIEAILMLESFIPGLGYPQAMQSFVVKVEGMGAFAITDGAGTTTNLGFPGSATALMRFSWQQHSRRWGGANSMNSFFNQNRLPARGVMPADGNTALALYPFVSIPITVAVGTGNMRFSGGAITIEVYNRSQLNEPGINPGDTPVTRMRVTLPAVTIPVPRLVATPVAGIPAPGWWTFSRDGAGITYTIPGENGRQTQEGRLARAGGETTAYNQDNPGRSALFVRAINNTGPSYDVVRTMVPRGSDYRLPILSGSADYTDFERHNLYTTTGEFHAHTLVQGAAPSFSPGVRMATPNLVSGATYWNQAAPDMAVSHTNSSNFRDFDNGLGPTVDGAYINLPDVGNQSGAVPYFNIDQYAPAGTSLFSPNRQVPSAGMFGSLPSRAKAGVPWRTLLFRPQPGHPGADAPHDHLWTDLFWMPVVEPYAISEPFSTAGKVNMNYQIAPFTYITRSTAVVGALRAELITAIPDASAGTTQGYKAAPPLSQTTSQFRLAIDPHETLKQFEKVFNDGTLFRSSSQIMEQWLVPQGQTLAGMESYWNTRRITGDNSRERPYANLLGRLTTKSNTYTVHYRVQALKKAAAGDPEVWVEGRDQVTGEQRGSVTIERYINPNSADIPDYAALLGSQPNAQFADLGQFYQWRALSSRVFAP